MFDEHEDRVAKLEDDLEAARRSARLAQGAHDIMRARVAKLEAALKMANWKPAPMFRTWSLRQEHHCWGKDQARDTPNERSAPQ